MPFCTDSDLLFYEPTLIKDCKVLALPVMTGTCTMTGTLLAATAAHFVGSAIRTGMLVAIDNRPPGGVRAIMSDTTLRVSQLHAWVPEPDGIEAGLGDGTTLAFTVFTFPQLAPIADELRELLDLDDATTFDPRALRRANALGALAAIFRSMATLDHTIYVPTSGSFDTYIANTAYRRHAEMYEARFHRALKAARVAVDLEGDGVIDDIRTSGSSRVFRE